MFTHPSFGIEWPSIGIDRFRLVLVVVLFMILAAQVSSAQVIFLTSAGCTKCAAAEKVLESELEGYDHVELLVYEFYTDEGRSVIREHRVEDVPSIIIGDRVIGYEEYNGDLDLLQELIKDALSYELTKEGNYTELDGEDGAQAGSKADKATSLSMLTVFLAGLLAGFNPCLLGILVFLATAIMSSTGGRRDLIEMIFSFSLGIFVVYYIFGAGMLHTLRRESFAEGLRLILSAALIALGLVHIEDARRLKRGAASLFRASWANKYIEYGLSRGKLTSYFLIGALFSLVKAPCVGAVYIAILGLLSSKSYSTGAVYLFLYNLGIILPVIALGCVITFGMRPETVDQFRRDHRAAIRLATGATLLALAPFIYFEII
jgi:cytochrome c biogenesis protein CcdA/glutaredoxin